MKFDGRSCVFVCMFFIYDRTSPADQWDDTCMYMRANKLLIRRANHLSPRPPTDGGTMKYLAKQVFRRLSPGKVARLLGPEIDSIVQSVYEDLAPGPLAWVPGSFGSGLVPQAVRRSWHAMPMQCGGSQAR